MKYAYFPVYGAAHGITRPPHGCAQAERAIKKDDAAQYLQQILDSFGAPPCYSARDTSSTSC